MPNEHGKTLDTTYLSVDKAEERGFLHRDYLAHCLRWSHVVKHLYERQRYKTAHILDIGCGREAPLIKTLYASRLIPASYTGIDAGHVDILSPALLVKMGRNLNIHDRQNILDIEPVQGFTTIVMFEALEHMEKAMGIDVLKHIQRFMGADTDFFMSTPCYDGVNKAANHVYEWRFVELFEELESLGYKIKGVWGTFASMKDYKHHIPERWVDVYVALHNYYDSNVLACIFAPLFPSLSRNCMWHLGLR